VDSVCIGDDVLQMELLGTWIIGLIEQHGGLLRIFPNSLILSFRS
jgi:hypothetical protein